MVEGLCRSLLKMNKHPEALKWAKDLVRTQIKMTKNLLAIRRSVGRFLQHATSHRNNEDHLTVSLGVLSEVYAACGDHLRAISCLGQVITYHPFVSDFWLRLASSYCSVPDTSTLPPISSKFRREVAAFCRVRAAVLLDNVASTVKSFVKEKNGVLLAEIKKELDVLKLPQELIDRMELFAAMDIYAARDKAEAAASGDFQDLGGSARLKAIEEGFRTDGLTAEVAACDSAEAFEKEWFSFLVE